MATMKCNNNYFLHFLFFLFYNKINITQIGFWLTSAYITKVQQCPDVGLSLSNILMYKCSTHYGIFNGVRNLKRINRMTVVE